MQSISNVFAFLAQILASLPTKTRIPQRQVARQRYVSVTKFITLRVVLLLASNNFSLLKEKWTIVLHAVKVLIFAKLTMQVLVQMPWALDSETCLNTSMAKALLAIYTTSYGHHVPCAPLLEG